MIKYFCDKCGKELPLVNNEFTSDMFKVEVEPPEIRKWADNSVSESYILCYRCIRKFNKWLNEPDSKYIAMKQEQDWPIPEACKSCSNHPSNGGSGICHCTLGTLQVKC